MKKTKHEPKIGDDPKAHEAFIAEKDERRCQALLERDNATVFVERFDLRQRASQDQQDEANRDGAPRDANVSSDEDGDVSLRQFAGRKSHQSGTAFKTNKSVTNMRASLSSRIGAAGVRELVTEVHNSSEFPQ